MSPPPRPSAEEAAAKRAAQELEQLARDKRTLFVSNLAVRAGEREVFELFSGGGVVTDVRILTDRGSTRSKGLAYIEFKSEEECAKAQAALLGRIFMGQKFVLRNCSGDTQKSADIAAQKAAEASLKKTQDPEAAAKAAAAAAAAITAAGRPRFPQAVAAPAAAAAVAAAAAAAGPDNSAVQPTVVVSNLPDGLEEDDIRGVFEAMGEIKHVEYVARDHKATVTFASSDAAMTAYKHLNGVELGENKMIIEPPPRVMAPSAQAANVAAAAAVRQQQVAAKPQMQGLQAAMAMAKQLMQQAGGQKASEALDDMAGDRAGVSFDRQSRQALMAKLAGGAASSIIGAPPEKDQAAAQPVAPPAAPPQPPSTCIKLENMFDPAEETESGWQEDIKEDVASELSKHGKLEHIFLDDHSLGDIYVRFGTVAAATLARGQMNLRWFGKKQVACNFMPLVEYTARFPADA